MKTIVADCPLILAHMAFDFVKAGCPKSHCQHFALEELALEEMPLGFRQVDSTHCAVQLNWGEHIIRAVFWRLGFLDTLLAPLMMFGDWG